jgi:hypothetical protein
LNECVDIPVCDSIFITYVSKSRIRNIQRLCRANRKWAENPNKVASIFLWCDEYAEMACFMKHLKEYDERFTYEKVKRICGSDVKGSGIMKISDSSDDKKVLDGVIVGFKSVAGWMENLEKVKKYIDENGRRPSSTSNEKYIKYLGCWINQNRNKYFKKIDCMKIKHIYDEWTKFTILSIYSKYFINNLEKWVNSFKLLQNYLDEHKKRPSGDLPLGRWIGTQYKNYKKHRHIMQNIDIYNIWHSFIRSENYKIYFKTDEESWLYYYNLVEKYLITFNKKPTIDDKDINISKLGVWLGSQLYNFNNNIGLMKRVQLRDKFNILLTNYKNCFITDDEKWILKLNQLKEFLNNHKKRPTPKTDKNLYYWLTDQLRRVDFKNYTIRNKLWLELINDIKYKVYFDIDNIKEWLINLNKLKVYIDENNNLPHFDDKTQIQLYNWIGTQVQKYKNKSKIMKNKDVYEAWTNLIVNSKYSKYFKNNIDEWKDNLKLVKIYIDTNHKIPNYNSKNDEIKKMGNWINSQKTIYKNNTKIMKNLEIYNLFKEFLTEYSIYFMTMKEYWIHNLKLVKKYISEYNRRPFSTDITKSISSLGNWFQFQIINFKNNKGLMKDSEIRKLWEDFTTEYSQYFT